jgi:hypothetical protein
MQGWQTIKCDRLTTVLTFLMRLYIHTVTTESKTLRILSTLLYQTFASVLSLKNQQLLIA